LGAGCVDSINAQRTDESHPAPMAMRGPSAPQSHVRLHPSFIYEYKPHGVDLVLVAPPTCAAAGDIGALDLGGEDSLF
jgi:hypothetical protein